MSKWDVIIIGSGLSGLSAAIECLERRKTVLILEARDVIGGRTSSWFESGMEVESGLHRVLGFYNHLPKLLKKAGLNYDEVVVWEDEIEIKTPKGPSAVYGFAPLFRPVQTLFSLIGNNHFLGLKDKIGVLRFFIRGFLSYQLKNRGLDSLSVFDYAKKHHVTDRAIHRLLVPLTEGIFFLPPQKYSAWAFFGLFSPAIIRFPSLRTGAFRAGMTTVMMGPIAKYIQKRGGEIKKEAKAERIVLKDGAVRGVFAREAFLEAENVILATALTHAQDLIRTSFPDEPLFKGMLELPSMSSVTFQLELESPSMDIDHTTFGPGTALSSFSEQSRTTFKSQAGRLSIILSTPEKFLNVKPDEILPTIIADAKSLSLNVERVKRYRMTRQTSDFYRMSPGADALKPSQKTHIKGLALAGDYTRQKFYSTMEGAVFSGKLAVKALFGRRPIRRMNFSL